MDRAGNKKTLTDDWASTQGLVWSASGKEIWFTAVANGLSRALYAVTPAGRPRQVAAAPGGMLLQDVSRDGRVLFVQENERIGLVALLPGETRSILTCDSIWADGKKLVYMHVTSLGQLYLAEGLR